MRAPFAVLALTVLLGAAPAIAQPKILPSCSGLLGNLQRDPTNLRFGAPFHSLSAIVADTTSSPDSRMCTAVAQYANGNSHLTYTAHWDDKKHTAYTVLWHETTAIEEASRAISLRLRNHPAGQDGTFSLGTYVPYCTDPQFVRMARAELRYGISFRNAFYKEPTYDIMTIAANGYGSGILSNCVATVGNDQEKGAVFLGTNWVAGETQRRYAFYMLDVGPDGWKIRNRLWELSAE